ncbi:efflux RND transporter periplasmic adaptor subunit [Haliea atlantica]
MACMFRYSILPLSMAMVLLLAGCDDRPKRAETAPPPEVGVVELQPQRVVLPMEMPGRITAFRVAEVRPQVSGILQERLFRQGAQVKEGEVLYRIDRNRYLAAYQRTEADLERARAELRQAQREWTRTSRMFEKNAVSERERDQALSALEFAQANVASARAAAETARIELDYTEVKAPIGGSTGPTLYTVGALVTASQAQPLTRIVQLDPIYVDIQMPVEKLSGIRRSLAAAETSAENPDQREVELLREGDRIYPHRGRLDVADVTVDRGTSAVVLRAVVPNPDGELLPGMYVRVRLREAVQENAILAPQQGVTRDSQGGATALVVNDEDQVVQRQLEAARAIGGFWLVEKGLEPGDRLIVSGLQKVKPGAAVKPVTADIPLTPSPRPHDTGMDGAKTSPVDEGGDAQ